MRTFQSYFFVFCDYVTANYLLYQTPQHFYYVDISSQTFIIASTKIVMIIILCSAIVVSSFLVSGVRWPGQLSVCCWYKIVAQPSPAVPPRYQHQHTFPVPQSHSLTVLSSVPAAATALIRPRHQENPVCLPGRLFSPDWQPRGCGGNNILYHTTSLNTSYQPECNGETFPSPTLCKVGGWEY